MGNNLAFAYLDNQSYVDRQQLGNAETIIATYESPIRNNSLQFITKHLIDEI